MVIAVVPTDSDTGLGSDAGGRSTLMVVYERKTTALRAVRCHGRGIVANDAQQRSTLAPRRGSAHTALGSR